MACQTQCVAVDQVFLWLSSAARRYSLDHAAEDSVVSDRGAERDHGGGVVDRWVLIQTSPQDSPTWKLPSITSMLVKTAGGRGTVRM